MDTQIHMGMATFENASQVRKTPQDNFGWRQNATKEGENGWRAPHEHGQNLPALGQQTRATLCERRCAKESEANAPAESAAIPEERLGAQEIQTQLTLKIRGLTASKGH
ncbi:hypothetical protein D4764_11G0007300 [Takifugu flavidus]|uniref:Uncharacterized protein n=1 Tax=Takifugu flavidus TaxID=433684 RepID=A0A5C6PI67_9TELE|nr:hypothetical protein D4764_11G0007300 [Takifugu flavidus]